MMTSLKSLGLRTELMISSWYAKISYTEDRIVVRTPSNPMYHWGNFVLFKQKPSAESWPEWIKVFKEEIAAHQSTHHVLLLWDDTSEDAGDVSAFLDDGFELELSIILTSTQVTPPPHLNMDAEVRPLRTDKEWEQALENQIRCRDAIYTEENYRPFRVAQMKNYRMLTEQGRGDWYGAFLGEKLVADLGIYHQDGLARYQNVGTDPEFRRQGLCGTLVYRAGLDAMQRHGVEHLVMIADPDAPAARIYQSVGFAPSEHMNALYRRHLGSED